MRSTVPNVKSITFSDVSGYTCAHIANGSSLVIAAKPNLPPQTDQECLKQLPIPNFLPDAVKKAAFWRFGDSNATSATRRIELVVDTRSRSNPQRVIAVGGLLFWVNNTPTTSGAVFVLGIPDYRRFSCIANFASPHTPGPTEIQLMYEVNSIGEIAARMILEDISLPEKQRN